MPKKIEYGNCNYDSFVKPATVPEGVENKKAYLVGSGIASLAAAAFLIRDGHMEGNRIHILESDPTPGGSLDGRHMTYGWVARGGREMEPQYQCTTDLMRSMPTADDDGISMLDEFYRTNLKDHNYSKRRTTTNRGESTDIDAEGFLLNDKDIATLSALTITPENDLEDKTIKDYFEEHDDLHFLEETNFWKYWSTMFAFKECQSVLELKRYLNRFVHDLGGLKDFSTLKFTKYNQYDSMVLPITRWLQKHGVNFDYDTTVTDIKFLTNEKGNKVATKIETNSMENGEKEINLTPNDMVYITNGSITSATEYGSNDSAPSKDYRKGASWELWEKIANKNPEMGNPKKFDSGVEENKWESFSMTLHNGDNNPILNYISKIAKRDVRTGKTVTGGIVTVRDSKATISWTVNRQPQFKNQPEDETFVWAYALNPRENGDFIDKPIQDMTGREFTKEYLYHINVPEDKIDEYSMTIDTVPTMLPYVGAYFRPRKAGDRPKVVPDNSENYAFIGNFAETPRDTVFTVEYSVRTAMEAVYSLLGVQRKVPEVFPSCFDIRYLMNSLHLMLDRGQKITDKMTDAQKSMLLSKIKGTDIETMMKQYELI